MNHVSCTYIVSSLSGTLYIGVTNNIERRMREPKSGKFGGFASKYHCNRLVYYEKYDDVSKAIGREKQLQGWTRAKKIALIEKLNSRWTDLAESGGAEMRFAGQPLNLPWKSPKPGRRIQLCRGPSTRRCFRKRKLRLAQDDSKNLQIFPPPKESRVFFPLRTCSIRERGSSEEDHIEIARDRSSHQPARFFLSLQVPQTTTLAPDRRDLLHGLGRHLRY